MLSTLLFVLFAGLALGCAVSVVAQRNPIYSAISLIGVFVALACHYVMLAAPFIAAVQVIVYAGAIMVLVVFVIMLLNVEEEERRASRWRFVAAGTVLGAILFAQAVFVIYSVSTPRNAPLTTNVGLTASIGGGLFTKYLLPFEITSILLLMAMVGAITLARRVSAGALEAESGGAEFGGTRLRGIEGGAAAGGAGGLLTPGDTEATGRAMAQAQIERGEAAAPGPGGGSTKQQ